MKRENQQLNATLKRYRKQLQELTDPNAGASGAAKDILNSLMSPSHNQKVQMSLDGGYEGSSMNMAGKSKLKRSESGTSSITNAITVTNVGAQSSHNNQATYIEAARIERLLQAFLTVQSVPDERFSELLSLSIRELKHSLLVANCANCTVFLFNPELQRQFAKIDKKGTSGLTMQKFAMEGGKWADGVSEQDREVNAPAFKKADDIRNGMKT